MPNLYLFRKPQKLTIRWTLVFILFQLFGTSSFAQLDTEFWFAPPELTESINPGTGGPRDRPIQLVISTLEKPARVEILQPADLTFTPIVLNLPANETEIVNLTPFINRLESKPENTVLKTGLFIRSTNSISAYYEIKSANNTDIFALKGANANGKKFYVPFQTHWNNANDLSGNLYEPKTYASFDIIATDDSTFVTVTPKKDLVGHPAGVPFTFRLDRGQVYSCRAIDRFGANHPAGSKIESTKDVAVTMKDDMLQFNPPVPGADIAGDQLIPVDFLGNSYVLVKGGLTNNQDRCYILATEDNTIIRVDGNAIPLDTLNEGEQYELQMLNDSYFLSANKKVSVLHISGLQDQVGGAVIPALTCTGTNRIGFTRTNAATFIVNVITKNSARNNFTLNGNPNLVPGSAFQPILGSNGWVYARITFSTSQIPAGTTLLLQNSGDELFHVGVTNYAAGVGSNYGYFSNFSRLNLGTDRSLCVGDTAILDAGPAKTSYLWNTGATTRILETIEPGTYWVNTLSGTQCPKTDTIRVRFYEPTFTLGPDDTICIGSSRLIQPSGVFTYTWQDGSTQPTYNATQAGVYWAQVADFQGCTTRDSILISEFPRPQTPVSAGSDTVCQGGIVNLSMGSIPGATYAWLDPDSITISGQSITVNTRTQKAGPYSAFIKINGCESFYDTAFVGVVEPPELNLGRDTALCTGIGSLVLDPGSHQTGVTYSWSNGSTDTSIAVLASGSYRVTATNAFGCSSSDTIQVTFQTATEAAQFSGSGSYCSGTNAVFGVTSQPGYQYQWTGPNGFSFTGSTISIPVIQLAQGGVYTVTPSLNGCPGPVTDTTITVNPSPFVQLGKDTASCAAFGLVLDPVAHDGGFTYSWSNGSADSTLTVTTAGTYSVSVSSSFCTSRDTVVITFGAGPSTVTFTGNLVYCNGTNASFGVDSVAGQTYSWTGPNGFSASNAVISIPSVQLNQAGTYTVTPSLPGCPGTPSPVNLTVRPTPVLAPMEDTSFCAGGEVLLDPVPNGGEETFYQWSNGLADSSISVSTVGIYSVIASTGFCQAFDTVVVGVRPSPDPIVLSGDTAYCLGQTATISISETPGSTYSWSGPGGFAATGTSINIPNLSTAEFGLYSINSVLGTCNGTPKNFRLIQREAPLIQLPSDTSLCGGSSLLLDPVSFGQGLTYSWNTGSTDSSLVVTNPGTYKVTISNGFCSASDSITVTNGQVPAPLVISGANSACEGGSINLSVPVETGVTIRWTGPGGFTASGNNLNLSNLLASQSGLYIAGSSLNGCPGTGDSVLVTITPTPIPNLGNSDTLCDVATVILQPVSGSTGLTFLWNTGSTDSTLTVTTGGTYSVVVSNGGCSAKDSITLGFGTTPAPLVITGPTSLCQGDNGTISVTGQTGVQVSWTGPNNLSASGNSVSFANIQPSSSGQYIVKSVSGGCTGIGDTLNLSVGIRPQVELGADQGVCNGSSIVLDPVASGQGFSYLWSTGSTDSILTVTSPGRYWVVVSGGTGCSSSDTVLVNTGTAPAAVTVEGDTILCNGGRALLTVPLLTGITYTWTGPNGFSSSNDTIEFSSVSSLNAGVYTVTPALGNCIGTPTSVRLTVNPGPIVFLGLDDTLCGNTPVILDPTNGLPGFEYEWTVGSTDSVITINQSGSYGVTVRYLGCVQSDTVTLTFQPLPLPVTIEGDGAQCSGDTLELSLQGTQSGTTYLWTGPNGFSFTGTSFQIPGLTLVNSGTYEVRPVLEGCQGTPTSLQVQVNAQPMAQLGLDIETCSGVSVILDPVSSSSGLSFTWNTGSTDTSLIVSQSGQYSVVVSNGTNCEARDSINVLFQSVPGNLAFTGDTVLCEGQNGSFGIENPGSISYSWSGPNGFSFTGSSVQISGASPIQAGYYKAVGVAGGCLGQPDSVLLVVSGFPTVSLGPDSSFCGSTSYLLDAGSGTGLSYEWSTGANTPTIGVSLTGIYRVTVRNAAGCGATDSVNLVFKPEPAPLEIIQGSRSVCENRSVSFEVEDQPLSVISWSGPNGFTASGNIITVVSNAVAEGNYTAQAVLDGCPGELVSITLTRLNNPTILVSADSLTCHGIRKTATASATPGSFILWSNNVTGPAANFGVGLHWAEASLNGCSIRDSFLIGNSGPVADFTTAPDSGLVVYEEVRFLDKSQAGTSPLSSWSWNLGFSQIRSEQNPAYTYFYTGEVTIQLIVRDNSGCTDTLNRIVEIEGPKGWFIPTLFTPNGDGENDNFEIGDLDSYPGTKVTIFNRWGKEEFSSSDYKNNWQGSDLVEGVYYYDVVRGDGKKFNGYVYLRR